MSIFDFLSPPLCAFCGAELGSSLECLCEKCEDTAAKTMLSSQGRCRICFHKLDPDGGCAYCQGRNVFFDSHISLFPLNEKWHRYLRQWKFENERRLALYPALKIRELKKNLVHLNSLPAVLIDSGKGVYKVRSYQPVMDLARLSLFQVSPVIRKKKSAKKQSQRGFTDRFFEIHNGLEFVKKFNSLNLLSDAGVILLEDLFTTGATANEAARILKLNGIKKVYLITVFFHEGLHGTEGVSAENRNRSCEPQQEKGSRTCEAA